MGRKFLESTGGWYVSITQKWSSAGEGRYSKRRLSKARRRYAKMECKGIRYKEPVNIESEVNWKNW